MTYRQKKKLRKKLGYRKYSNARKAIIIKAIQDSLKRNGREDENYIIYTVWSKNGKRLLNYKILEACYPISMDRGSSEYVKNGELPVEFETSVFKSDAIDNSIEELLKSWAKWLSSNDPC